MAILVVLMLILGIAGGSDAIWCICRNDASDNALQSALDYACGHGGDCSPISANGACYLPNSLLAHCSYATNSYFQKNNRAPGTCDFSGTATNTTVDPSSSGCQYPSDNSVASPPANTGISAGPTASNPPPPPFTPFSSAGDRPTARAGAPSLSIAIAVLALLVA
ncbi:unnamed protein product [Spirodela intermedia]|uniref:X8 domain-containing protein n=1 Tax=Spirodela intermedia TaxID=51605 RepID=A0A7I8K8W6_SPIIN|nr:unnamed protein product [Spirodela intermedia]